jgi:hypothetical protein
MMNEPGRLLGVSLFLTATFDLSDLVEQLVHTRRLIPLGCQVGNGDSWQARIQVFRDVTSVDEAVREFALCVSELAPASELQWRDLCGVVLHVNILAGSEKTPHELTFTQESVVTLSGMGASVLVAIYPFR